MPKRYIIALLYHALPLVAAAFGAWGWMAAGVLAVLMAYVKVAKLSTFARELANSPGAVSPAGITEMASLRGAIRRWRALTFLPDVPVGDRSESG